MSRIDELLQEAKRTSQRTTLDLRSIAEQENRVQQITPYLKKLEIYLNIS